MTPERDYLARVQSILDDLRIPSQYYAGRSLPLQLEAQEQELEVAEVGPSGREYLLIPAAAAAWRELKAAAAEEGVELWIVSAFRSVDRQAEIVRNKLAAGQTLETMFASSAPPGYSEHHTGRAVDVGTHGARPVEEEFENTPAFRWLAANAGKYRFVLSFPRGNACGYVYEPWHWCFRG